jgi:opacity protein-like surface antigen
MMKVWLFFFAVFLVSASALAGDSVVDLSSGCKVYKLQGKKWVETDSQSFEGLSVSQNQILKAEAFTVFKTEGGTFGLNQRCLRAASEPATPPAPTGKRRTAAPAPLRGDTHSLWTAVFSVGYNAFAKGTDKTIYLGQTTTDSAKFSGAASFIGEANYRVNAAFRLAGELGLSQLSGNVNNGNETSFFDVRPEYVLRASPKIELYVGPMIGVFIMSQNTEDRVFPVGTPNAGTTIHVSQQTASSILLGIGAGADYAINEQFDVGAFLRYFKPGTLKVTGTTSFPASADLYESDLSASYVTLGLRFGIHF